MVRESKYEGGPILDEVVCHDDRLVFRGQKAEVKLDPEWWKVVPKTGEVLGWWNTLTDERLSVDSTPEGEGWVGCQARAATISKGVSIYAEGSYIDVRMNNLWEDLRRRYRVSLDALVAATERGVLTYRPMQSRRVSLARPRTDTEKRTEAMRLRFRRHWHAVAYEHDLIIPTDIGRTLIEELRPIDMAKGKYPNTVYAKGYGAKESLLVKAYDMMEKHGVDGVKIEVTLRQEYLDRNGLKDPATWETQPDIQAKVESTLRREWSRLFGIGKGARGMLAERVRVPQAELFDFVADSRNTLASVLERLDAVERKNAQHDRAIEQNTRDIEQLKRATGLR